LADSRTGFGRFPDCAKEGYNSFFRSFTRLEGSRKMVHGTALRQFLCFEVADRRFGLWSSVVLEAVRAVAVVPLPKAPPAVRGVINLRGKAVPVFDLRHRFGLPPREVEVTDHFVIARAGARTVALHADRAIGLLEVAESNVEEAKKVTPAAEYVEGIVKMPDGLVLIHDPATFLSTAESERLDEALGPVSGPGRSR